MIKMCAHKNKRQSKFHLELYVISPSQLCSIAFRRVIRSLNGEPAVFILRKRLVYSIYNIRVSSFKFSVIRITIKIQKRKSSLIRTSKIISSIFVSKFLKKSAKTFEISTCIHNVSSVIIFGCKHFLQNNINFINEIRNVFFFL